MTRLAAVLLALVLAAGCGVSTEDEPQPIEETSIQQPPAIPSVDTEPGPPPTTAPSTSSQTPTSRWQDRVHG